MNLPQIHAKYAEFEASIGIEDGEVLAGQQVAWMELAESGVSWLRSARIPLRYIRATRISNSLMGQYGVISAESACRRDVFFLR
ncbi:MAG: hypothetical protein PHD43_22790 [Methylococcales bacterium]|nr:hypothetical protein [Methylococcales bacterium]